DAGLDLYRLPCRHELRERALARAARPGSFQGAARVVLSEGAEGLGQALDDPDARGLARRTDADGPRRRPLSLVAGFSVAAGRWLHTDLCRLLAVDADVQGEQLRGARGQGAEGARA